MHLRDQHHPLGPHMTSGGRTADSCSAAIGNRIYGPPLPLSCAGCGGTPCPQRGSQAQAPCVHQQNTGRLASALGPRALV